MALTNRSGLEEDTREIDLILKQVARHHSKQDPFCVILDDFEKTNLFPEIQKEAERLCLETGEEIRFFFISRKEVFYSLRKIRSNKDLIEIRTSDLILHPEEVRELFTSTYGINLPEGDYEKLHELTGGWITAISFLLERLIHLSSTDQKRVINTFFIEKTLPEIDDYLENDVLKKLDPSKIKLLIYLNMAETIYPEMIEEFAGIEGKGFLAELENENLYIQLMDPTLYIYQFLPFFSEYLKREYHKQDQEENRRALLKLSDYYEKHQKPYLTIHYLLESGEIEKALNYLTEYSEVLLQTGEYENIRSLLSHFPSETIEKNLLLSYYRAVSNSILHPAESQKTLMELQPQIHDSGNYDREAKLYSVLLTSYFFYQTSGPEIITVVEMASSFLGEHKDDIARDRSELLFALLPLGQWWISPAKDPVFEAALHAEEISHRFNNHEAFLCSRLVLIRIYLEKGEFREALHLLRKTEALMKKEKKYSHLRYYRTLLSFYMGDALFYMGEIPAAIAEAQKGLSFAPKDFSFLPYLQLNLILYNLYLDNIEKAESLYNEIRNEPHGANTYLELYLDYFFKLLIAYRNKNVRRADYFCRRLLDPEKKGVVKSDYPYTYLALTEVLIFLKDYDTAGSLLTDILTNLSPMDYPHSTSSALGLSALLEIRKGNKKEASAFAARMTALQKERMGQNLEICDPEILKEINELTIKSSLAICPRLIMNEEINETENIIKPLEIYTLGKFQVFIEGEEISSSLLSGQKRVMDLLKFLIVFRKNGVMKERIYELFWPRYSYKSARDNLNTIIYRLRKMMGDSREFLITDVNNIRFNPDCTSIDVDRFLDNLILAQKADSDEKVALAMKLYRECISMYPGDFLKGDLYYDFIRDERENLQNKYRGGLFRMIQLSLDSAEYSEALEWAKKLIESDPLCEAAYRLLMICSSFVGSRSEIPRIFDKLNKKLQTYYKIQADEKTVTLKNKLLSGTPPSSDDWLAETII
ncbi:MAG: hypothetical protein JEY99_19530 [Spirochaetales bacterium]|nr:hypothetical protein [Spirochaetales bacterium]